MKRDDHVTVRAAAAFEVLAEETTARVPAELRYDTRDPFAVAVVMSDSYGGRVTWSTSRDLLADGLITSVGEGDVRIRPKHDKQATVRIEVNHGYERTVLQVPTADLADFLDRTYEIVTAGTETRWMDVDAELLRLLSADSPDSE